MEAGSCLPGQLWRVNQTPSVPSDVRRGRTTKGKKKVLRNGQHGSFGSLAAQPGQRGRSRRLGCLHLRPNADGDVLLNDLRRFLPSNEAKWTSVAFDGRLNKHRR